MQQYKYGRKIVLPSLNKVNIFSDTIINGTSNILSYIFASGHHTIFNGDRWGFLRKQPGVNFMLDWAEPYVNDYRYRYYEDDTIQYVYPEVQSPWKFPDSIYLVSGNANSNFDGFLVEPSFWDPDPKTPPINSLYKITEPSLPEHGVRVVISGGFEAKCVTWGPEHNLPAEEVLMCAPMEWLGRKTNKVGEEWEIQGNPDISVSGIDTSNVAGTFPKDPNMPFGDPDPFWDDGLDEERVLWKSKNRKESAIKRYSSDKLLSSWGDIIQGDEVSASINEDGDVELEFGGQQLDVSEKNKLLGKYDFPTTGNTRWFDPSRSNQVNPQTYPRRMTKCLFCYQADKCIAANNPVNKVANTSELTSDPTKALNSVGTIGFKRNYFVNVPESLVPNETLAKIYANSYCMYNTNSPFDRNFASIKEDDETLESYLERNNNTSSVCHVNGAPRRVVEYDGHYKLLLNEILHPLMTLYHDRVINIHQNRTEVVTDLKWDTHTFKMEYMGLDYQDNHLYKVYVDTYPDLEMGQYKYHYGVLNESPKVLFYISLKWSSLFSRWLIPKTWAYIWYASNHTTVSERVLIKRLVELKSDYGMFYGNATEARTSKDFSGGNTKLESLPAYEEAELRGKYKEIAPNSKLWYWDEEGYSLHSNWASYKTDINARASGVLNIIAQPGEVIPNNFIAYKAPKMITWGKSRTDQITQKNLGKTRWHFDTRTQKWVKEVGDIDDLYYHLRYDDPRAEGALTYYENPLGTGKGWFSHFLTQPKRGDAINVSEPNTVISDPLNNEPDINITETNSLEEKDIALISDMQHARNFTAPIFAYHLTSRVPYHQIVKPDLILHETDWGRRQLETDSVMYQREYCPTPAIWCFAKNSTNRERYVQMRKTEEGPIELIWLPEGRVWWHRQGVLGAGMEFGSETGNFFSGESWNQTGVAIVNLWKKYLPHHMEVVKSYLWLEPVQEDIFAPIVIRGLLVSNYDPFQGIKLNEDDSDLALEVKEARINAGLYTDIPGHPVAGYQIPINTAWQLVVEGSHKILGEWSFPQNLPMEWDIHKSTEGWSEWDINHSYKSIDEQSEEFIARNLKVLVNGQYVKSIDTDSSSSFAQRSKKWYTALPILYKDGYRYNGNETLVNYCRNSNKFTGLNNINDNGEGQGGNPDPDGKAYGHSTGGGGRKAPFIFDITNQTRQAYNDRIDVTFSTVVDIFSMPRKHTNKNE